MTCQLTTILHINALFHQWLKLSRFYQFEKLPLLRKLLFKLFALFQVFNLPLFYFFFIWLDLLSDLLGMLLQEFVSFPFKPYFLFSFELLLLQDSLKLITFSFCLLSQSNFLIKHLLFSCLIKFLMLSLLC